MGIVMTEELLFKIDRKIRNEAPIKYGDDIAGAMFYCLDMYHQGFYKVIPENWVEYIKEIEHENDQITKNI